VIFINPNGPIIDFIATAKKFGKDVKPDELDKWAWNDHSKCLRAEDPRHNYPTDLLISIYKEECDKWLKKGGLAWHFDLSNEHPYGEFLHWWFLK